MSALICGSFAYDTILVFQDQFKNHILPDKVHMLNVSFLVPEMRREFGGCAGNIAYNLQLLGGAGAPMGTVGKDFGPYADWMDKNGISREYLTEIAEEFTGQAYITTDLDDNQITAFHPGAMGHAQRNQVPTNAGISLGLVSPDGRDGMIEHAAQFAEANIPFIFDPGQGMPMFDGDDLKRFIEQATWVTVNDYEMQMLQERTGLSPHDIAQQVEALIVTRGGDGAVIHTKTGRIDIPPAKAQTLIDPTGCGDAFRAGLLVGLMAGWGWDVTGRVAALAGCIKIESAGPQNHRYSIAEFAQRFEQEFGMACPLVA